MTSDDFKALTYTEKTEAVLTGTYLADRSNKHCDIKLYNVDNFYVEVFFDCRSQLIIHFRAFKPTLFILPYLENLKIAV
ncbi:hypothetical protein MTO98_15430 [Mucilaginibacter sp. SMC90]|uniref:hypothetical protein n=1 Tax=Mucilaginibacter sp. SMC90 TaxID=2929803 RepID=UPI001FB43EDC|nr:hypothetical protein [Mucilaginibacter sp. SMC90]UOE52467.1 hypothetical protein MTO98_15430 [Mucilaginibacter sp. SMC90]